MSAEQLPQNEPSGLRKLVASFLARLGDSVINPKAVMYFNGTSPQVYHPEVQREITTDSAVGALAAQLSDAAHVEHEMLLATQNFYRSEES